MSYFGLGVIVFAWIIQLSALQKGRRNVDRAFVAIYCLGVALLVIDGFQRNLTGLAIANLVSLASAAAVLISLAAKK